MSVTAAIPDHIASETPNLTAQPRSVGALVMAADYRALGVVRSLGRRGIPVWVLKHGGHLVATTSRYVRRNVPWPTVEDNQQVDSLMTMATRNRLDGWVL